MPALRIGLVKLKEASDFTVIKSKVRFRKWQWKIFWFGK